MGEHRGQSNEPRLVDRRGLHGRDLMLVRLSSTSRTSRSSFLLMFAYFVLGEPNRHISAANIVEAALVIDGSRDPIASRRFDDLIRLAQIIIEPVTEAQFKGDDLRPHRYQSNLTP
jgi:hypothetical protein